ncbi:SURF1 family protein [Nocardioides rubriscoriae]|uniref:SURF1 family cytochrome oxidase biogenesis protein n=1 Tax=Nocardioides rubriscoriae TaxID=642762 RepID=UPI0011DF104F|nr:SURF1 family protein [Nocardioides rubriscoriae]
MGSYRFLLSRRWVSFAVVVVLLAGLAWWLGEWQFGRLHDRQGRNEVIRTNEARPPAPVDAVLSTDRGLAMSDEWRRVEATGTYDVDHTVIVRYRSNDEGAPGVDVVVPLVTDSGASLIVDRGFLQTDARSPDIGDVPPPPTGVVTVVGWARVNGTGDSTEIDTSGALSTRAVSSDAIGAAIGRPVYDGFVDAVTENGQPVPDLADRELPELDNGPHFFYGLQWWFFGVLAVFGFGYLAYDERKRGPRGEREQDRKRTDKVAKVKQTNVPAQYQRR